MIFYFSGTGNSLKVAEDIAKQMQDCEVISMGSSKLYELETGYETKGLDFLYEKDKNKLLLFTICVVSISMFVFHNPYKMTQSFFLILFLPL